MNRPTRDLSDGRPGDTWRILADQVDRSADAAARVAGFFLAAWAVLELMDMVGAATGRAAGGLVTAALVLILLAFGFMVTAAVARRVADRRDARQQGRGGIGE